LYDVEIVVYLLLWK